MLQRLVSVVVLVLALTATGAAQTVIGLVDVNKIVEKDQRFVRAQKEIDVMVARFEGEREDKEKELQELSELMQSAQQDGRDTQVEMYRRRLQEKSRIYQEFMTETFGEDGIIPKNTDETMGPLFDKLEEASGNVGRRLGIDLVLDIGSLGPLYYAETLDITDEVLAEFKTIR